MDPFIDPVLDRHRYNYMFHQALEEYKTKTKRDLRSHPLLPKLQICESPDAVLALLRDQIPVIGPSRSTSGDDDRLTKWLNPTVHVLYMYSKAIRARIRLVSKRAFEVCQFRI